MSDDSYEGQDFDNAPRYEGQDFDSLVAQQQVPDATSQQAPAGQSLEGQDFDSAPRYEGQDFDALVAQQSQQPQPEGPVMTAARNVASGIIPAAAGMVGAGAGAAAGAVAGPVGAFAGGAAGYIAGSSAADWAQDKAKEVLGLDDSTQRAVNAEANPVTDVVSNLAPALATMNPAGGAKVAQRAFAAVAGGGFEAGRELVQGEDWNPAKIALNAGAFAVFPAANKIGEALEGAGARAASKMVPGRPNVAPNPDAAGAHADAGSSQTEIATGDNSVEQSPPVADGSTTGNPQSAPARSERQYGKTPPSYNTESDMLTTGDYDPATAEALKGVTPEESPLNQSGPRSASPQMANPGEQLPIDTGIVDQGNAAQAAQAASDAQPADTGGFPQAQPQAPQPEAPVQAPASPPPPATAAPVAPRQPVVELKKRPPGLAKLQQIKTSAQAADTNPTPAQIEAGNQKKGHDRLFGKPFSIENAEGSVRRSKPGTEPPWEVKVPYTYGDLVGTRGADGDPLDVAVGNGDQHFIIDQRDANTGKFDEHKIFAHMGDEADARARYNAGFSDDKGPDRLGAITPVTEEDLTKWVKNPAKKSKPYSPDFQEGTPAPAEEAAPVAQPKVVTATVKKLRASDNPAHGQLADAIEKMEPGAQQALAAAKADVMLKTGKVPDNLKVARIRPEAPTIEIEGKKVQVKSAADGAKKLSAYQGMLDAVTKNPPAENEAEADTRARAEKIADQGGKHLLTYRPNEKPAAYMLVRAARDLIGKKIGVSKFVADEKLLRSGDADAINQVRQGNRIEADIAKSKRAGEGAIQSAENARFDIPHEEAEEMVEPEAIRGPEDIKEPTGKTLDMANPADHKKVAEALETTISKQKAERAAKARQVAEDMRARTAARAEATDAGKETASPVRKIDIGTTDTSKYVEMLEKARKRSGDSADVTSLDKPPVDLEDIKKRPTGRQLLTEFAKDQSGAGHPGKFMDDMRRYFTRKPHKSYISREAKTPEEEYARSLDSRLNTLRHTDVQAKRDTLQWAHELPKELNNEKTLERLYFAHEEGKINALSAQDQSLYNTWIKPMLDLGDTLFSAVKTLDPDKIGPAVRDHLMRITKGSTPEYDVFKHGDDPLGDNINGITIAPKGSALKRTFFALQHDGNGKRFVISVNNGGYTIHDGPKATRVRDPSFEFEQGKKYQVGNDTYTMDQATTREIEDSNARFENGKKVKYYHNVALSAGLSNYYLGSMARHLQFLHELKSDPTFLKFATSNPKEAPEDWIETKLPNFKGWKMDPQLAHVMDDHAMPGIADLNALRKLATAVTKTIFWLPTAHINNVGAHWFVARGGKWIVPKAYHDLITTGAQAIKSVITQDDLARDFNLRGAGTMLPGVLSQGFMDNFAKSVGEDIKANPSKWDPIAKQFGYGPSDLVKAIYKGSSKVMWAANDMFLIQHALELEKSGLSREQAITEAERHIPNYRIPATVMGSWAGARLFSKVMKEKSVLAFGPYHYGVFNSYANMAKDLVKGNGADKLQAVGNLMAIGILALGVYPALDQMAKAITGNPDASQQRRGPLAIPAHIAAALRGEENFTSAGRSTLTLSPLASTAIQGLSGTDWRGKNIVEPGTLSKAAKGSPGSAVYATAQLADWLGRSLLSPYSTLTNTLRKKEGVGEGVVDQVADLKDPSEAARKYVRNIDRTNNKAERQRLKKPEGLLEGAAAKLFK